MGNSINTVTSMARVRVLKDGKSAFHIRHKLRGLSNMLRCGLVSSSKSKKSKNTRKRPFKPGKHSFITEIIATRERLKSALYLRLKKRKFLKS